LTLLEVILALTVLAVSMSLLGELVRLGARSAGDARDVSRGVLVCQSILSEVVAGAIAAETTQGIPYELEPEWLYSLDVQPTDVTGLVAVRVTVVQDVAATRPVSCTLVRWMPDPTLTTTSTGLDATASGGL
jgi:hypothetical protein